MDLAKLKTMAAEFRLVSRLCGLGVHQPPYSEEELAWIHDNDSGWLADQADILDELTTPAKEEK